MSEGDGLTADPGLPGNIYRREKASENLGISS